MSHFPLISEPFPAQQPAISTHQPVVPAHQAEVFDADVITTCKDLLDPLEVMYRSLVEVGDGLLAHGTLLDLIRRVRTFGISMAKLDLNWNQIGDVGAKAIAEAVRSSGSMGTLCLNSRNIGDAAKQSLRESVQSRQGFKLYV